MHIHFKKYQLLCMLCFCVLSRVVSADQVTTIGGMAELLLSSIGSIAQLITALSYISGIGFMFGAIMKLRQHKDNPTQIPIGTPFVLMMIAAMLLFFPTFLTVTGMSIFGTTHVAGPEGIIWGVN